MGTFTQLVALLFILPFVFCQYDDIFIKNETELEGDKFDWNIFKTVTSFERGNTLLSPLSLKTVIAILYMGASAKTLNDMKQVMGFPDQDGVKHKYDAIIKSLQKHSDLYDLSIGSRMYLDNSIKPEQKYRAILYTNFKTEIKFLDVTNPGPAVVDANQWVKSITQGRIDDLVQEADMEDVVVLLLNTIYFKGNWLKPFDQNETKPGMFYLNSSRIVNVPFMRQTDRFLYHHSDTLQAKILQLPYMGDRFSMYIVLPNTINGLNKLINDLNPNVLKRNVMYMEERNVKVLLPKFKFEFLSKLVPALKELGLNDMFESTASFPQIAHGSGLPKKITVSNIIQKAGIDVNEVGTTAFAATEITLVNKFGDDESFEEFKVTKPFLFYIEDKQTNQILFMGKMEDPTQPSSIPVLPLLPGSQYPNAPPVLAQGPVQPTPTPTPQSGTYRPLRKPEGRNYSRKN